MREQSPIYPQLSNCVESASLRAAKARSHFCASIKTAPVAPTIMAKMRLRLRKGNQ